jgi:flagellar basal-body rod protein FlgC
MGVNSMFSGLHISASGMRAQRIRQNVITSNLANVETTRTPEGGAYRREFAVFAADEEYTLGVNNQESGLGGTTTNNGHMKISNSRNSLNELGIGRGVKVSEIRKDSGPLKLVYNPSHPDSNKEGYVEMPNINMVEEMANMISATRAYEANTTAFNATKAMLNEALQI